MGIRREVKGLCAIPFWGKNDLIAAKLFAFIQTQAICAASG